MKFELVKTAICSIIGTTLGFLYLGGIGLAFNAGEKEGYNKGILEGTKLGKNLQILETEIQKMNDESEEAE